MIVVGDSSLSCATMSVRTCGVAVAVSATVGGQPSFSRTVGDAQIARAEVVAPFADAVRFVDREQRHAGVAQPLGGGAEVEALGRDVQQLDVAANGARQPIRDL